MKLFSLFLVIFCSATSLHAGVQLGIDVLQANDFDLLRGKRVGLVTNQTGVNANGVKTRKILHEAKNVKLVALFSPEHGLDGVAKAGKYVASSTDALTGLPAHSLYGPTRKPSAAMLRGIDVLVFDMQDIGARTYTYVSTMGKCMQAAGEAGIEFVVLDRPNPLGGNRVEGPGLDKSFMSFIGQFPVPYVHGLTTGELALMSNERGWLPPKCKLQVVKMRGWQRDMTWSDTGLRWVQTSPNIPRGSSPFYYVLTGTIGELNPVELGINSPEPFEIMAAKWADADAFAAAMNRVKTPGVRFSPVKNYRGADGVRIEIDPDNQTNLSATGLHLLAYLNRSAGTPNLFARSNKNALDLFYKSCGNRRVRQLIEAGVSPEKIAAEWEPVVEKFRRERARFLLY